jgi:N-acetylglucosamine-6-phosphate deacetylase
MEIRGAIPTAGLADGIVTVESGVITGIAAVPDGADPPASSEVILPGLIDIHCHGGGGCSFATFVPEEARAAAAFHARRGTTGVVASLVTATPADLLGQVRTLAPLVADGTLDGIHLEGPFLSPARRGAHAASLLLDPDETLVAALLSAAAGAIKIVTIAPERTGATVIASMLRDAGVTVAFGHTDTDYAGMAAALAGPADEPADRPGGAGGALVTHLGNAMAPLHHRAAGPVAAALVAAAMDSAWVELIADGIHVDAGFTRLVFATAAPGRVVLVTDAMAAAGMPDGAYALGPLRVTVAGGVARLAGAGDGGDPSIAGNGSIAGGTRTLLEVVATSAASGVPLAEAVIAASETPARVLGLPSRGALSPGMAADLVITDTGLAVRAVMRAGGFLTV